MFGWRLCSGTRTIYQSSWSLLHEHKWRLDPGRLSTGDGMTSSQLTQGSSLFGERKNLLNKTSLLMNGFSSADIPTPTLSGKLSRHRHTHQGQSSITIRRLFGTLSLNEAFDNFRTIDNPICKINLTVNISLTLIKPDVGRCFWQLHTCFADKILVSSLHAAYRALIARPTSAFNELVYSEPGMTTHAGCGKREIGCSVVRLSVKFRITASLSATGREYRDRGGGAADRGISDTSVTIVSHGLTLGLTSY